VEELVFEEHDSDEEDNVVLDQDSGLTDNDEENEL
jgi:hypothetical protein